MKNLSSGLSFSNYYAHGGGRRYTRYQGGLYTEHSRYHPGTSTGATVPSLYVGTRSGENSYLRLFTDVARKRMRTASLDTVETAAALSEKVEMTVRKKTAWNTCFLLDHSGKKQELAVSVSGRLL